jgi:phosphatidylserine/phosphatidylglycerophosphate/cardiolipin synthase-like enzyme
MEETKIILIKEGEFTEKVVPLINESKKEIYICVFDWRISNYEFTSEASKFNQALLNAKSRGVNIKCLVNDANLTRLLNDHGIYAKSFRGKKFIHAKCILIDDDISIIGSHNLTYPAFETNLELSVIIFDKNLNKEIKDYFELLLRT